MGDTWSSYKFSKYGTYKSKASSTLPYKYVVIIVFTYTKNL
jgi:hypothetical protein